MDDDTLLFTASILALLMLVAICVKALAHHKDHELD